MTEYRITKYNPANRVDGVYVTDEWTSFGDIGKEFGGTKLSHDVYLKTEQSYIDCCIALIEKAKYQIYLSNRQSIMRMNSTFPQAFQMQKISDKLLPLVCANNAG